METSLSPSASPRCLLLKTECRPERPETAGSSRAASVSGVIASHKKVCVSHPGLTNRASCCAVVLAQYFSVERTVLFKSCLLSALGPRGTLTRPSSTGPQTGRIICEMYSGQIACLKPTHFQSLRSVPPPPLYCLKGSRQIRSCGFFPLSAGFRVDADVDVC